MDSTKPAFNELTKSCLDRKLPVDVWRSSEHSAIEERGDKLKIFDIKHKKPLTFAEISLQLTDDNKDENDKMKIVHWISDGIKAENNQ